MQAPSNEPTRIYFLPNLLTAGNLICGFLAVLAILQGSLQRAQDPEGLTWMQTYERSLYFILAACICDLLDGRVARLARRESAFGREFDSLADVVSFGVAPALLVFKIVLYEFEGKVGWIVAVIYLLCGALRLARFNVTSAHGPPSASKDFTGFPIPAAAGLISSITLLMLYFYETQRALEVGYGKYLLAGLMIFLSFMMFSRFTYPSFKVMNLRGNHSIPKFIAAVALLGLVILCYQWMLAVVFVSYLLYGFLRPFISMAWRKELEDDEEDETP